MTRRCWMASALLLPVAAQAQARRGADRHALGEKVQLKGKVTKVQLVPGAMPSVVLETGDSTTRVILGSMRYLIEQDFNPKAGDELEVGGFRSGSDVVAVSIRRLSDGRTLKLREQDGSPVWRGARGKASSRGKTQ